MLSLPALSFLLTVMFLLAWRDRRTIAVGWPRDFDHYASATYKAYRDKAEVREEMTGWALTKSGMGLPKSIGKQAASASPVEPTPEISPIDPAFQYHKQWKFTLSGVALTTLAGEYNVTVPILLSKSINSTHFLKMASKAKKSALRHPPPAPPTPAPQAARTKETSSFVCIAEVEAAAKAAEKAVKEKVPKALADLIKLQEAMAQQLERESEVLMMPLLARKSKLLEQLSTVLLGDADGTTSSAFIDVSELLKQAVGELDDAGQKARRLRAELKAKHLAQIAELQAGETKARVKRSQRAGPASQGAKQPRLEPAPEVDNAAAAGAVDPPAAAQVPMEETDAGRTALKAKDAAEEAATAAAASAAVAAPAADAAPAPAAAMAAPETAARLPRAAAPAPTSPLDGFMW